MLGRLLRRILVFCKVLYALTVFVNILFIFTYVLQFLDSDFASKYLLYAFDTALVLLQSCVLFFLFGYSIKAFDFWSQGDKGSKALAKVAVALCFVSALDALRIIYGLAFMFEYAKLTEGFLKGGSIAVPAIKFIEENAELLSTISHYFTPRPEGIFGLFLGLFIFYFIDIKREPSSE